MLENYKNPLSSKVAQLKHSMNNQTTRSFCNHLINQLSLQQSIMCYYIIPQKMYQCKHTRPDGEPYYDLCLGVQQGTKKMCSPLITDTSKCRIVPGKCPSC